MKVKSTKFEHIVENDQTYIKTRQFLALKRTKKFMRAKEKAKRQADLHEQAEDLIEKYSQAFVEWNKFMHILECYQSGVFDNHHNEDKEYLGYLPSEEFLKKQLKDKEKNEGLVIFNYEQELQ